MKKTFLQQLIATALVCVLVLSPLSPVAETILALEMPSAPENTHTAPSAPENTNTAPVAPDAPSAPSGPSEKTATSHDTTNKDSDQQQKQDTDQKTGTKSGATTKTTPSPAGATTGTNQGGNVGDTAIQTGDATSDGALVTTGNANTAVADGTTGSGEAGSVQNTGNGAGSTNNARSTTQNNRTTDQNNAANVKNGMHQVADSGNNDSYGNVGNTTLVTGDANVSGTAVTAVNTNVDGLAVAEFNVVDDQRGDLVLDFSANCISGCGNFGTPSVINMGNGAYSDNTATADTTYNNATFQNNDATIGSSLVLAANSGDNTASMNTGGNSAIYTGDANVAANVLTLANNNIAGNVLYGVVNIYGNLVGDILLPESQFGTVTAANTGNGSGSQNNASVDTAVNNATFQNNDATITNNILFDATTGNNDVNRNTGGSNTVVTGDSNVMANVLNIANSNIVGGTMWLVLVNEAGNWVGRILGAPDGQNYAGSEGTAFSVDQNGAITASNGGNGANSANTASANTTANTTTVQNNTANIQNNLDLSANTGDNNANDNTGGNNHIQTGDAQIIANIVNFVNNNVVGPNGKLVVTVVNVFGSWLGDFVSPGQEQQKKASSETLAQNTGGPQASSTQQSVHSNQANSSKDSKTASPTPTVKAVAQTTIEKASKESATGSHIQTDAAGSETALAQATDTQTAVLGESVNKVAGANVLRINLAWIVLLLPFSLLYFARKRMMGLRSLIKRV